MRPTGLPPSRRRRLVWCWAALTAWSLGRLAWSGAVPPPSEPFAAPVRVDPATASIPELMSLPGMGRARAAAVVLHRVRHGPFRRLDDLAAVDGIGPATVARWRPFLLPPGSSAADDKAGRAR